MDADTKVEFISAKLDDINKTKQGYCLNLNDEQQLQCSLLVDIMRCITNEC
jgi:hypothetical protein